jgi:hypothetical protein
MKLRMFFSMLLVAFSIAASAQVVLFKKLNRFTNGLEREFNTISSDRKAELKTLANKIVDEKMSSGNATVVFASNDNSSLSQMSQAWMQVALDKYGIRNVSVVSYGESQAKISQETVAALKNAGFKMEAHSASTSKSFHVLRYSWEGNELLMFSKKSDNYQIPTQNLVLSNLNDTIVNENNASDISKQTAIEMMYVADIIHNSHLLSLQQ